ncbi:MAG: insulinase family protein [Candidatus Aminicenantes bacterium]|nr:insulinase family protein [Candidatus Aminicenantes bacterium]
MRRTLSAVLLLVFVGVVLGFGQAKHPSELRYPALKYEPPDPKTFRTEYANSLRAYVQEDNSLPLFNITALINFGGLYVPKEKTGLDRVLGDLLIRGGTKTRDGAAIEERIDFLGGSLNFMVGERTSQLSLSVLSKDLDEGLAIFFDVLMNPEFREDPLKLAKARLVEQLRQVNDQPSGVLSREYERLLYGDNALTWDPTKATYEGISAADLRTFHAKYFFPRNIILAVSGDFAKADLKAKVNKFVAGWKNKSVAIPSLPKNFPAPEPGVYFIQKAINQGYISLGHLGLEDTNPDYFAVQVMNFVLGGGSFTSRITTKVRSDEGLSYNQGSRFAYRWGFPGTFSGYVQTKSETVGYAISLILAEFDRIRKEPVSDAEMETAINYYLESFADSFQSPQATMGNFANLEMTGKPMDYYKTYRDKIKAVTKARVQEVANKYVRPGQAAIMIVGDWEPCNKGGAQWPGPLEKLGKVHKIALRDPMTGELPK